ncbi:LUC7-domain-containing protein [Backusella circina FSU 941]|nr:LUC7-domain-containing protein [Backusella circina FSU 941]
MDYQKAMLEELMSQYVDVDNKDFWDDSICKHYIVAFCPSQLFTNTKSDLGACDKIHNDRLKERYQKSNDKHKYPYEAEFYDYLNKLISDLSRKIRQGNGRLNIQSDDKMAEIRKEEREEKMVLLDVKIKELLQKVEEAGEEGRVQEATDMQKEVEKLQEELTHIKENTDGANKAEKRMEVCDVCGAFLVTNDSSDRLEAHYQGKQHQGYLKIRDTIEQMKQSRQNNNNNNGRQNYSRQRYDYHDRRDGGRQRDYRRYSDRERGYNRDRHRDRREEDDFASEADRYSRRSRRDYDDRRSRSRSPMRRSRYD